MELINENYAFNPVTGRLIKKGTAKYKKFVKLGMIVPGEKQTLPKKPVPPPPIKEKLATELTDIVKDNKAKFGKELTQEQTDALLKKLLFEKLCLGRPNTKISKAKIRGKTGKEKTGKERTKKRYKLATPPQSSDDNSSSDSSSE